MPPSPTDPDTGQDPIDALPPRSGYRRRSARIAGRGLDALLDTRQALLRTGRRIDAAAAAGPSRRVTVLGVYGAGGNGPMAAAVGEIRRSRHEVAFALGSLAEPAPPLAPITPLTQMRGGKLANLNRLAAISPAEGSDWVLLLDDDVVLSGRFLDRLLAIAERHQLSLMQPALTQTSHTAWPVTRRRAGVLRQTRFVEMGPVLAMRGDAFATLSPFPEEGMGWGICLHWAAVAESKGWKVGIADAVPVRHDLRPPAQDYDRSEAQAGARELLGSHEHINWRAAADAFARFRGF